MVAMEGDSFVGRRCESSCTARFLYNTTLGEVWASNVKQKFGSFRMTGLDIQKYRSCLHAHAHVHAGKCLALAKVTDVLEGLKLMALTWTTSEFSESHVATSAPNLQEIAVPLGGPNHLMCLM